MKTWLLTILNLAFVSVTATAMPPHASLSGLTKQADPDCNQTSSNNGLKDLIQQVNLVSKKGKAGQITDGRGLLGQKASEIGLSAEESQRLRRTVGDIVCPGRNGNGIQGTAFLVGSGGQIVTNAHIFLDRNGKRREPLSECFWQDKEKREKIYLKVDPASLKLFTADSSGDGNWERSYCKDLAIVRLVRPVPMSYARPFRLETGSLVRTGDELFMISAYQEKLPENLSKQVRYESLGPAVGAAFAVSADHIAERCFALSVSRGAAEVETDSVYSDCSSAKGASGAPVLTRLASGELVIKAVHKGGGLYSADNTPFTMDDNAPRGPSYSYAIELNNNILGQIETFEALNDKGRTSLADGSSAPGRAGM